MATRVAKRRCLCEPIRVQIFWQYFRWVTEEFQFDINSINLNILDDQPEETSSSVRWKFLVNFSEIGQVDLDELSINLISFQFLDLQIQIDQVFLKLFTPTPGCQLFLFWII